jgi:Rrf2 family transcriptional regulator, iron-sulfur cluster assembly transcription factor
MRKSPFPGDFAVLTKTADYALRALLVLGRRGVGQSLPAEQIAELTGTPANYLGKTLYALVKAGLLQSTRGRTGGFALAVTPEEITVARIAGVFAEPVLSRRCLLGTGPCDSTAPCGAHDRWKRLATATREPLDTTTIADLLADAEPDQSTDTEDGIHLLSGAAGAH